ncbi:aminoglycoside phosphotransferase [Sorangium cellulosum]|uniref:Aminoglycoside phosphotransferase n=1 Tax=Sorangium cellulosum TaxID=56 RepID=A0A150U0I8_SORCE|nr:aminoglycoside phosphotransferase [Sorangium cellulosum]
MESRTKNTKTRPQIAAMAARAFGGAALASGEDAVRELKEGWFNAAYDVRLADGREVILKIAPPRDAEVLSYEKNLMATEVAAMRLVRQNPAIPAPEVYFYDDARALCDSDYFFMEKMSGDNLEHVRSSLPPEAQASIDLHIGEIIREINGFTGAYFGYEGNRDLRASTWREAFLKIMESVLDDGARKNVVYDHGYDEIRAAVLKHASALEEITTPRLVHWDAWDLNLFVKDGRVTGIIDFERALWADPLMESQFRSLFSDGITHSMRGYGKTSFTREEERRCCLYSLHLALVMNTECYYRNYDTDSIYNISKQLMGASMDWLKAH